METWPDDEETPSALFYTPERISGPSNDCSRECSLFGIVFMHRDANLRLVIKQICWCLTNAPHGEVSYEMFIEPRALELLNSSNPEPTFGTQP